MSKSDKGQNILPLSYNVNLLKNQIYVILQCMIKLLLVSVI